MRDALRLSAGLQPPGWSGTRASLGTPRRDVPSVLKVPRVEGVVDLAGDSVIDPPW